MGITNAVTVVSVNGPGVTIIDGGGAVRGAYLGTGAVLCGFTVTNGHVSDGLGAGILSDADGVVSNCVIVGCSAMGPGNSGDGGGVFGGRIYNCLIANNVAEAGGGACGGIEAERVQLFNCVLRNNRATVYGGGACGSDADTTFLVNCTLVSNSCDAAGGGGGAAHATLVNCIIVSNAAENVAACDVSFSCTAPDPGGEGNVTNDPGFVGCAAGDYHLVAGSPCIDAGTNDAAVCSPEMGGGPRIVGARVDMGAYEHGWLWEGSADLGGGWRWFSWFGFFCTGTAEGWIYHNEHAWMYPAGTSAADLWLWTPDMGWLWTSQSQYPFVYRNADGAWLWYLKDSRAPRWFNNLSTGMWEQR